MNSTSTIRQFISIIINHTVRLFPRTYPTRHLEDSHILTYSIVEIPSFV